ncbi:MAG: hypothetical protein ACE5MK_04010 [Acidobacteriota bacterium]
MALSLNVLSVIGRAGFLRPFARAVGQFGAVRGPLIQTLREAYPFLSFLEAADVVSLGLRALRAGRQAEQLGPPGGFNTFQIPLFPGFYAPEAIAGRFEVGVTFNVVTPAGRTLSSFRGAFQFEDLSTLEQVFASIQSDLEQSLRDSPTLLERFGDEVVATSDFSIDYIIRRT